MEISPLLNLVQPSFHFLLMIDVIAHCPAGDVTFTNDLILLNSVLVETKDTESYLLRDVFLTDVLQFHCLVPTAIIKCPTLYSGQLQHISYRVQTECTAVNSRTKQGDIRPPCVILQCRSSTLCLAIVLCS